MAADGMNRRDFLVELLAGMATIAASRGVVTAQSRGGLQLAGPPQNVVILGGGLAGLAAAYELRQAGHSVTLLEARKAPGGRIRTFRGFADAQYAEGGPHAFPSDHQFTWGYATDFGLALQPAFVFGLDSIGYLRGNRFRISGGSAANVPFNLSSAERQAGIYNLPSLYLDRYMRLVGNPLRAGWPPDELRQIDGLSLTALLQDLGASQGAIELIEASQLGILGFGLGSISALDGVVTEAAASGAPFYEIRGGMDELPYVLKQRVKKQFKKRSVVLRVEQDERGATVTYTREGEIISIPADRVICTLPFPVLHDVTFVPALSAEKQRIIRDLKYTPVTRTYQQFRSRVWELDRFDGSAITDLDIQNVYSPTQRQGGQRGILVSYTGGQRAIDLGGMSERDRQDHVLRRFNTLFGSLDAQFESGTSHIWHEDPWARGGFAYFEPGTMLEHLALAQRPEGRIHFAGEHTSVWHGWMNGALESGNRAAAEVNSAGAASTIHLQSQV